jgi:DNA-binding winged helix-turn-helix (wHTH) protein/tetratricopeptide (TPR) repeat protein
MDKLAQVFPPSRIDLARESDFALGDLQVRPPRREVERGGVRHVLQPRVMQVLVALAQSPNQVVSQHELIARCWDGLSVSDDAIGRCIAQLRRLAASWPEAPFEIETIAGVGYCLEAVSAGSGEVLGVRVGTSARRGLIAIVTALALVVLGGLWLWQSHSVRANQALFPTVAVTAFQPADGSPEAKAIAATLAGEVSDAASGYDLVVVKPTPFDGLRRLSSADFLLNGRVLRKGAQLTVTSELVAARQGVVIYAFDTPVAVSGPNEAASVIAARLAHALDPSKLTNDLGGKLSASDYTLVARANEAIDLNDWVDALGQVQALARRHPSDGDLEAATAITAALAALTAPPADRAELVRLARRSIANAERLNPNSALLYVAKGFFANGPLSYAEQESLSRKAIELEPTFHVAFNGLGEVLISVGRCKEGAGAIRRSIQLDPMSKVVVGNAIQEFVAAGDKDQAEQALARYQSLWPGDPVSNYWRILVALYLGAPSEVPAIVAKGPMPAGGGTPAAEVQTLLVGVTAHDPASVRDRVRLCFASYGRSPGQAADSICLLEMVRDGALDDAFRFAELAYPDHRGLYPPNADGWLLDPPLGLDPAWLFTPRMKPFRDDPRFWDVALRAGLVDYWLSTGAWPDDCEGQVADCKRLAEAAKVRPPAPHGAPKSGRG